MVPLPVCWAHTRDKVQREVVLSNLQATTTVVGLCIMVLASSISLSMLVTCEHSRIYKAEHYEYTACNIATDL